MDHPMTLEEAFNQSDILRAASPESREALASFARIKKYGKGRHVFYDMEDLTCFYILVEGLASLYKLNTLGEKKVIFAYGPGNLLNEMTFGALPSAINCEVREDSLILILPRDRLWRVMSRDGEMTKAAFQAMSVRIRRLYRQLKNTTNAMKGEKRLAAKLYMLARDYGRTTEKGIFIDLPLSITYLSEMLGSKRETVSRQVKKLCDTSLIVMEKNHFWIMDLEKLSQFFKEP